jgi:hypothetical protein
MHNYCSATVLFWFSSSMLMPRCLVSEARGNGLGHERYHVSDPDRIMDVFL